MVIPKQHCTRTHTKTEANLLAPSLAHNRSGLTGTGISTIESTIHNPDHKSSI